MLVGKVLKDGRLAKFKSDNLSDLAIKNNWCEEGMDYLLGNEFYVKASDFSENLKTYDSGGEFWIIYERDLIYIDEPIKEIKKVEEIKSMNSNQPSLVNVEAHGNFKSIFVNGKEVKTPQEKINYFYNTFSKGLDLASNQDIKNVEMLDDLTFKFEITLDDGNKKELLSDELDKLSNDLKSNMFLDNFDLIKKALTENDGMLQSTDIRKFKVSLVEALAVKLDTIFDNVGTYKKHSECLLSVFNIREQEAKFFRFITRNVLKALKRVKGEIDNYKTFYGQNLDEISENILEDYNKLTNVINIKSFGTYYLTFDSNKIIQCSYNTGGNWRSCYNIEDGEYRNSALYCASHNQMGLLYSLTSQGYIKNRRIIAVNDGAMALGKWYPNTPKGMVNPINNIVKSLLGLEGATEDKDARLNDYSPSRANISLRGFEIYYDFASNSENYVAYKNRTSRDDIYNVYANHKRNELFNMLQEDEKLRLDTKDGDKHYFDVR